MTSPKVFAVIPAYNEEDTISLAIDSVRRHIPNIIVVNDGSTDRTGKIAQEKGAIIVNHGVNCGLGKSMQDGIDIALKHGADVILTFDADMQYDAEEIPKLLKPIIENNVDLVLGSRFAGKIEYMPSVKRWGNRLFTRVTRWLAGTSITDAQTGFRAIRREAAEALFISSAYTYTQEMIIRAAKEGFRVVEVPIVFRKRVSGESRLISNPFEYGFRATQIILRTYRDYHPLKFFGAIGVALLSAGMGVGLYLLYLWSLTELAGARHFPLIVLCAILNLGGVQIILFGFMADMISNLRRQLARRK